MIYFNIQFKVFTSSQHQHLMPNMLSGAYRATQVLQGVLSGASRAAGFARLPAVLLRELP